MENKQYRAKEQGLNRVKGQKPLLYGKKQGEFEFQFSDTQDVDRVLRQPRSAAYLDAFYAIDMLSETDEEIIAKLKAEMDEEVLNDFSDMSAEELLSEIKSCVEEEFAELEIELRSVLHGVIAKCYIDGCDCHAINPQGEILEHFKMNRPIPDELHKGRELIMKYPDCKCVEVYTDCCRVIHEDGTVLKIKNKEL